MTALRTRITLALAGIGMGITAILTAGHAHADPQSMDEQYLALLKRDGIGSSEGISDMITVGHGVCSLRMQGYTEDKIAQTIYGNTVSSFTLDLSKAVVHDAEQVYCPGYLGGSTGSTV